MVSTLDKTLTPMIPKEVQDSNYIIPEDSKNDWIRGGLPTREMVRNKDYLEDYQKRLSFNIIIIHIILSISSLSLLLMIKDPNNTI